MRAPYACPVFVEAIKYSSDNLSPFSKGSLRFEILKKYCINPRDLEEKADFLLLSALVRPTDYSCINCV